MRSSAQEALPLFMSVLFLLSGICVAQDGVRLDAGKGELEAVSKAASVVLQNSVVFTKQLRHRQVTPLHILYSLFNQTYDEVYRERATKAVQELDMDLWELLENLQTTLDLRPILKKEEEVMKRRDPNFGDRAVAVMRDADERRSKERKEIVMLRHLLLALLEDVTVETFFASMDVYPEELDTLIDFRRSAGDDYSGPTEEEVRASTPLFLTSLLNTISHSSICCLVLCFDRDSFLM